VDGTADVATPEGNDGPVRPRIGQIRVGFDRSGECIGGRVMMAHPHLDQPLRAESAGVVGLVLNGMFDFVASLREIAAFTQQDRTVQSRVGVVRLQDNDPSVSCYRLVISI
jgi:hypothetical protein